MLKGKRSWIGGLTVALIILIATPVFARSISLKDTGVALWIFIIIGAVVVLLQLIPAMLLFFSFIGTTTELFFKKKKVRDEVDAEEKIGLPGCGPLTVEK